MWLMILATVRQAMEENTAQNQVLYISFEEVELLSLSNLNYTVYISGLLTRKMVPITRRASSFLDSSAKAVFLFSKHTLVYVEVSALLLALSFSFLLFSLALHSSSVSAICLTPALSFLLSSLTLPFIFTFLSFFFFLIKLF